ncbi:YdcF family protein [Psychrobacter phenylpyruvicus]|uniref:DUF218 domain n=1 Tax=Psychrobacter phenylpyruvicus TaxID=29432 RepID=A0A379LNB1_9GAMM|nr:YdcF family protein [Psychrobacter phenylpyruvicus]SUD91262.1 DUF218 domain [Psychrobacter phenylpyruvicus]
MTKSPTPIVPMVNIVIKTSLVFLLLGLMTLVGFYTPVFSTVGLWVLNHLPIPKVAQHPSPVLTSPTTVKESVDNKQPSTPMSLSLPFNNEPTAYVVLGGGLTEADTYQDQQNSAKNNKTENARQIKSSISASYQPKQKTDEPAQKSPTSSLHKPDIVLNDYTLKRMQTVMQYQRKNPLPIILTGVDAPWMQDWLYNYNIDNVITENASMNTCENARFTAKRLHLQNVYLITDAYHMTRARRQFALNGIRALPIPAPLPMEKGWLEPSNNAQHSRRTLYELAAYARDVFVPQDNCRQASEVSFETLLRSRKPEDVKTF